MQRRIVDAEIVAALDSRVPREITDEILSYVIWRWELRSVKKIEYTYGDNYYTTTHYIIGIHRVSRHYDSRGDVIEQYIFIPGKYFVPGTPEYRNYLRMFWAGKL